jgi:chorismate mutase
MTIYPSNSSSTNSLPAKTESLDDLRKQIDQVDLEIVELLSRRFKITEKVGVLKAKEQLPALDKSREQIQFERFSKMTKDYDLPIGLLDQLFELVMTYSKARHRTISQPPYIRPSANPNPISDKTVR